MDEVEVGEKRREISVNVADSEKISVVGEGCCRGRRGKRGRRGRRGGRGRRRGGRRRRGSSSCTNG